MQFQLGHRGAAIVIFFFPVKMVDPGTHCSHSAHIKILLCDFKSVLNRLDCFSDSSFRGHVVSPQTSHH